MSTLVLIAVIAFAFAIAPSRMGTGTVGGGEVWAFKPPTEAQREKAGTEREKDLKAKAKAQCASGCRYGKDRSKTGKCYEPREGQTYFDCQDAKYHIKKIEKVNTPWGQGGKGQTKDKKEKEEKKEEKVKKKSG